MRKGFPRFFLFFNPSYLIAYPFFSFLDQLIEYLILHPVFSKHELVWEFLLIAEIDKEMIIARTKAKANYLLEDIYDKYEPVVEDRDGADQLFLEQAAQLNNLSQCLKNVAHSSRKVGKYRKGEKRGRE